MSKKKKLKKEIKRLNKELDTRLNQITSLQDDKFYLIEEPGSNQALLVKLQYKLNRDLDNQLWLGNGNLTGIFP